MSEHEKVNILMVDDQPAKLLSYEVILSELGENLIKASSGREALEHLLKTDIAVVLMDVSMPEIDGFELAAIIRQHPRYQKTAIIFISAVHLTDLDRLKGYEYGAVDYIAVPVIPDLLRAKVSVFAELYRLQAAIQKSALEWQLTFDTIESPILILDLSGMVIRLNRAAKELLGNSYQESIGRTVEVLGSGQPWQKAAEIVRLIRETRCATSCQARDEASGRTWDMAASLLTGPGVAEERIILVARDITRMVELQA